MCDQWIRIHKAQCLFGGVKIEEKETKKKIDKETRVILSLIGVFFALLLAGIGTKLLENAVSSWRSKSDIHNYGFETMFNIFETNYWIPIVDYDLDEGWGLADCTSMYGYIWEKNSFKYTWMTVHRGQSGTEGALSPENASSNLYVVKNNDCISYNNGNNTLTITSRYTYNGCIVIEVDCYSSLAQDKYKHTVEKFIISENIDWSHSPELIKYGNGYLRYYFLNSKYF